MKIVWSLLAISDREAIFDYIEADSPRTAAQIDDQIEARWISWRRFLRAAGQVA